MTSFDLEIELEQFRVTFSEDPGDKIQVIVNGRVLGHRKPDDAAKCLIADRSLSAGDLVEVRTPGRRYFRPAGGSALVGDPPAISAGRIGIGIITYNRLDHLRGCLEKLKEHTPRLSDHALIVADDASVDGTAEWCREQGVAVIGGENRGVVHNKNRALYYLFERAACEQVLLIEDDCWPNDSAWLAIWSEATRRHHHVNYVLPHMFQAVTEDWIRGSGTAQSPYRMPLVTGQCSSLSKAAFHEIGYLDPRFVGFGAGHVEWSFRFHRSALARELEEQRGDFCLLRGGLVDVHSVTYRDEEQVRRNRQLRLEMGNDPVFKMPWTSPEEQARFMEEVSVTDSLL